MDGVFEIVGRLESVGGEWQLGRVADPRVVRGRVVDSPLVEAADALAMRTLCAVGGKSSYAIARKYGVPIEVVEEILLGDSHTTPPHALGFEDQRAWDGMLRMAQRQITRR